MEHAVQIPGKVTRLLTELFSSEKYRLLRYLLFIAAVGLIGYNQTAYAYRGYRAVLGGYFYLMAGFTTVVFIGGSMVISNILVPGLLMHKRYGRYFMLSFVTAAVAVVILWWQDWFAARHFAIPNVNGNTLWPGIISTAITNFGIYFICFTGVAVTMLLKTWMVEERQVAGLRKQQLQAEVSALKEQVSPQLLFDALNTASSLCSRDPELSADMIMQLSSMLRYQLYDGEKRYVSLAGEMEFINDYFSLSGKCGNDFTFTVNNSGLPPGGVFIPPLLPASLAVAAIDGVAVEGNIDFSVGVDAGKLRCRCTYDKTDGHKGKPDGLHTRLTHLFGDDYVLNCTNSATECELMLVIPIFGYNEKK